MNEEPKITSIDADKENRKLFPDPEVIRSQDIPPNDRQSIKIFETRDLRGTFENRLFFPVAKGGTVSLVTSTNIGVYSLPDLSGTQSLHFTTNVPTERRIIKIEVVWSTSAVSLVGYFQVDISYAPDGETNAANTTGGTPFAITSKSVANQLYYMNILKINGGGTSGVNVNKIRPNDTLGIKFTRFSSDSTDTLSAPVLVYGIIITYSNF